MQMTNEPLKAIGIHIMAGEHRLDEASEFEALLAECRDCAWPLEFIHSWTMGKTRMPRRSREIKSWESIERTWRKGDNLMTCVLTQDGALPTPWGEPYTELAFWSYSDKLGAGRMAKFP